MAFSLAACGGNGGGATSGGGEAEVAVTPEVASTVYLTIGDLTFEGEFVDEVIFKDAGASTLFSFFGATGIEQWTLNMVLAKTDSKGVYEGEYTIDIAYDMSGFQQDLPAAYRNMDFGSQSAYTMESAYDAFNITQQDSGAVSVSRKLTGKAIASDNGGAWYVDQIQESDNKSASMAFTLSVLGQISTAQGMVTVSYDIVFSGNQEGINSESTNAIVTMPDGSVTQGETGSAEAPFDANIWLNGSLAEDGWEME